MNEQPLADPDREPWHQPGAVPYTLRLGVTGHRHLDDPQAIEEAVGALLDTLEQRLLADSPPSATVPSWGQRLDSALAQGAAWAWPALRRPPSPPDQNTPLRWCILSPLAKGSDRIVARAVLDRPQAHLEVVTPFPLDEYRKDFDTPEDHAKFEALLARDPAPTELHPEPDPPASPGAATVTRNVSYLRVGRRIVEACELLIAVWDGQPAQGTGGTADVVRYAVESGRRVLWVHATDPSAPVRLLTSAEAEGAAPGPLPGLGLLPLPATAKALAPGYHKLAAYNRGPLLDPAAYAEALREERDTLQRSADEAGLPGDVLAPVLERILPHYIRADQLAVRYRDLYKFAARGLFVLAAFAVTVVVAQVLFFPHQLGLIAFEILAMVLAVLLLRMSRHEAWHEKWLHDRHLAERLRMALFTALVQPVTSPAAPPNALFPFYRDPDSWVASAYTWIVEESAPPSPSADDLPALRRFLIDGWIGEQAAWHASNAERKAHAAHRAHRLGLLFFGVTLTMAALHLLGVGHGEPGHGLTAWVLLGLVITFLAIVLPAWGAAVHAITNLLDRERIAERSRRMTQVLARLQTRAEEADTLDDLREVAQQAEHIMATENAEWWISLSFRELVLPT
ncbi:MAG: hypothetical protein ACR2GR_11220 [Rhodothermales bacterium]